MLSLLAARFERPSSVAGDIVQRAARELALVDAPRIDAMAARFFVSERFLRKAFADELGMSPKLYARTIRIRRAARAAATETTPWATLATTCGFFDQAHMNAEFRDLLRATPTAFRAGAVPSSTCKA